MRYAPDAAAVLAAFTLALPREAALSAPFPNQAIRAVVSPACIWSAWGVYKRHLDFVLVPRDDRFHGAHPPPAQGK